jgi:hypothetical protein
MSFLRRFLGFLVLLLSIICFIGCVAGIVGIWIARQDLSERTRKIASLVEVGLGRASAANQDVGRALEKARDDVAKVNQEIVRRDGDEKDRRPPGILRRLVWQEVGPKLNDLGGRLVISSDAAVMVSSLPQSLMDSRLTQTGRINPQTLERLTNRSSQLSASLQKLQAMVGDGDGAVADKEVTPAARDVDLLLRNCQTTVDEWQSDLDTARQELPYLEAEILGWITLVAIVATVVCSWVALSQISLFAHALKWCRGHPGAVRPQ